MDAPRKSNRQRREEIRNKRLARAERLRQHVQEQPDVRLRPTEGWIEADGQRLAAFNSTYGDLPTFYVDVAFRCRDCGEEEVWTARQQRWWYETIGASIFSSAVRCHACRRELRRQRERPGADRLRQETAALRALADQPADELAWALIEAGLASKWSGVRAVALETLGYWRSDAAIERLRAIAEALPKTGKRDGHSQDQDAVCRALAIGARDQDGAWILEWLRPRQAFLGWNVVARLSLATVESYVLEALQAEDMQQLHRAMLWLLWRQREVQPDGLQQRLRQHPNASIAHYARRYWPLPNAAVRKM